MIYSNTLQHDYVLDDFSVIKSNTVVTKGFEGIPEIISNPYRFGYQNYEGNLYRPLPVSVFAIQWAISPDNPFLGHLTNVVLYSLCGSLLFLLLLKILPGKSNLLPLLISFLFIAHPIHTEVVANIKSLDEILVLLFLILTLRFLWNYIHPIKHQPGKVKDLGFAISCYVLALFSKESAITFIAIIPLVLYLFSNLEFKKIAKTSAWFVLPALLFLLLRASIIDNDLEVGLLDNSLIAAEGIGQRVATALYISGLYLWKLLFPIELVSDFGYDQIPLTEFSDWRVLLSLIVIIVALVFALKTLKQKPLAAFGILFYAITFSVSSNLLVLIGTNYGERLTFLPSLGFVMVFGWLLMKLSKGADSQSIGVDILKKSPVFAGIIMLVLGAYIFQTVDRNTDWKTNYTLYEADIQKAPNSARVNYQYGLELGKKSAQTVNPSEVQSLRNQALVHLEKAVDIYPEYSDALALIGVYYVQNKQPEKAIGYYQKALSISPGDVRVLNSLGKSLAELNRHSEAKIHFHKATQVAPNDPQGFFNLGILHLRLGEYAPALNEFQKAERINPNYPNLKRMIEEAKNHLQTSW